MTDQKSPKDQAVHVPRYAFEVMAARTALDEDKVAVMLLLLMRMDRNRAVRVNTSLLSDFLTLSSERVEYAISSLIKKGWVESVDDHAMPRPRLCCAPSLHTRRLRYADEGGKLSCSVGCLSRGLATNCPKPISAR